MPLPGPIFESLTVLLKDAFNRNSMEQLIRFKMGADMYKDWVAPNQPFKKDVYDLLTALESAKMLAGFLDHVITAREDLKPQLLEIRAVLDVQVSTTKDQTAAITSSVENVAEKLQLTRVREIVMQSRGVLTELAAKIDLLRTYKSLHDALHTVKMCFRSLEAAIKWMSKDPESAQLLFSQAVESMETEATKMASIISEFPAQPQTIRQDELEWLARFNAAITIARGAVENCDQVTARQGAQGVRTLLKTEPTRIDGRLSRTADEIDLTKLKDLFAVAAAAPELAADAPSFEQGQTAVEQLLRQVKAQINQHTNWQSIDRSLDGADDIMRMLTPDGLYDFDALWKGLKEGVNVLIAVETQAEWAKKIATAIEKVDATRAACESSKLRSDFNRFRQEATVQFFVVDTKLKSLATEVNVIGEPLRKLLEKL